MILAALATIGLGLVLGPEAPLLALGSGLGILAVRLVRKDAPEPLIALVGAAGSFAAVSFIFGSPLIGAVILIEAAALDRRGLQVVLPVGLLASGIGVAGLHRHRLLGRAELGDFALAPLHAAGLRAARGLRLRLDGPAGRRDRAGGVRDLRDSPGGCSRSCCGARC